ncbi:MAG: hypothetical protein K0Q55_1130 [Verrucomicrobia bacterium]|nr:hypothetical protein [Verrucomicrobiota bacterium]
MSDTRSQRTLLGLVRCFLALISLIAPPGLLFSQTNSPPVPSRPASSGPELGQSLARTVCATCHLYPPPESLNRAAWALEVLPKMRRMMGLDPMDYAKMPGGKLVEKQRPFPAQPLIGEKDWEAIRQFYLATAPETLSPLSATPATLPPSTKLQGTRSAWRETSPAVSLVKIDPFSRRFYVADALSRQLMFFNRRGELGGATQLDLPAVHLVPLTNGFYLTLIGDLYPSDEPKGEVVFYGTPKAGALEKKILLKNLHRPVHTLVTDVNSDGKEDLVVSAFGNFLGRLSWYENQGDDRYEEHILIDRPGAIATEAVDLDRDGKKDLVVLMAQAWEGIYWLRNEGNGKFKELPLLQWPPSWGSTSFRLIDFNGDGFLDILATNGDNGDFETIKAPLKPYHGVRIYLNDGRSRFTETYHYPVHGAYKAIAVDLQGTGRADIIVSAYFPDFTRWPAGSLTLLENQGKGVWQPHSLPEGAWGRWFVMDAGDLDGDGRPEIVTGSYPQGPGLIPKNIFESWQEKIAPLLIFRQPEP